MEKLREHIDIFFIETNRTLYGWRLWLVDLWSQGSNQWLILSLLALATLVVFLFLRERESRRQATLLRRAAEKLAQASSIKAVISLLFETVFEALPLPAACLYLAATAEGPFPLKGKQANASLPLFTQPDWEPEILLEEIPQAASIDKKGVLAIVSLPVAMEGQPMALLQFAMARPQEARRAISASGFLTALAAPILTRLSALERIQRLEEQSREAAAVSGSSQLFLSTTLGAEQLANMLLDLAARSTQSDSGLILLKPEALEGQETEILAAKAMDPGLLQELLSASREESPSSAHESVIIEQLGAGSAFRGLLARAGFRSLVQAPIVLNAAPVGRMVLLKREGGFRESHFRICQLNASRLALTIKNRRYHEAVFSEYKETLKAIVQTLESSSPFLDGHSARVSRIATELARALGPAPERIEGIELAGELHDVGMAGLSDEILLKAGRLTATEYDLVKYHPVIGAALTAPIRMPIPIAPLILHHHERYDGHGYPAGLKGAAIPLGARILALGEVFDAMLTARTYRQALSFSEAVSRLRSLGGTQLDREIVDLFIRIMPAEKWRAVVKSENARPT